jgi:hypothetical protein
MSKKFRSIGHYDFAPNTPVTIANPLLWSISASCHLHTTDAADQIQGSMLKGSGKIDGKDVPKDGLSVTIANNDTLTISASALASVKIVNTGKATVSADCGLSYETLAELEYIENLLIDGVKFLD